MTIPGPSGTTEVLRNDKEWSVVEGDACRVKNFIPWARVEGGRVIAPSKTDPYASLIFECSVLPADVTGFVTHRTDFLALWAAFSERGVGEDEEVIVFWWKTYSKAYARLLSKFMPRLCVRICRKGAFELLTDPSSSAQLSGLEIMEAIRPLAEWKPDVME